MGISRCKGFCNTFITSTWSTPFDSHTQFAPNLLTDSLLKSRWACRRNRSEWREKCQAMRLRGLTSLCNLIAESCLPMDTPLPPQSATSSVRGAALASTCTGSTPQAHAARTCHAKEGGVGISRHCYGVKAAFCVVVAVHASADGRDSMPVLRAMRTASEEERGRAA